MKDNLTEIIIVLDRSGSMSSVRDDTIGSFNSFLEDQKKVEGEAILTLAQFDDEYEIVHERVALPEVPALNDETFVPRGWTALLDAMGRTINEAGARLAALDEDARPGKVVFVVITDGQENRSTEFTAAKIKEMVEHQEKKYNWEILYLSSDINGLNDAASYGIKAHKRALFAKGGRAYAKASAGVSNFIGSYRKTGRVGNLQRSVDSASSSSDQTS